MTSLATPFTVLVTSAGLPGVVGSTVSSTSVAWNILAIWARKSTAPVWTLLEWLRIRVAAKRFSMSLSCLRLVICER